MIRTQDYFFILENYDPELGRFIQPDPKHQTTSPYLYAGNNPMMYVDPDGQLFFIDDALIWGALAAAAHGAAIAAAVSVTVQYTTTGQVNWDAVGSAALGGAFSAGLSFGVGELGKSLTAWGGESLMGKTIAHGISGGIQSTAGGGGFGSGFAGGSIGNLAGGLGGDNLISRTAFAGLGGGAAAWATGGSFGGGFQSGAYNQVYNWGLHEAKAWAGDLVKGIEFNMGIQGSFGVMSSSYTFGKGADLSLDVNPTIGGSLYANAIPKGMKVAQSASYGFSKHLSIGIVSGKVKSNRKYGIQVNFGPGVPLMGPINYSQGVY